MLSAVLLVQHDNGIFDPLDPHLLNIDISIIPLALYVKHVRASCRWPGRCPIPIQ